MISNRIEFDIVSSQFCIHYMFEKESMLRGYLENVSTRLAENGVFMATTIDSDRLVYKIRESGPQLSIKNKYFSVIFDKDTFNREDIFAQQYYFYLQESVGEMMYASQKPKHVPEYLITFKTLCDIAAEYDLVLEKKVNFHEYYDQMVTRCEWEQTKKYRQDLLQRMVMNRVTSLDQEQIEQ